MIKTFLNPEWHQNPISGSIVTAILLNGRILPIGGASAREGLRLQPAQQACCLTFKAECLPYSGWPLYGCQAGKLEQYLQPFLLMTARFYHLRVVLQTFLTCN